MARPRCRRAPLLLAVMWCGLAGEAEAGAWGQPPGHCYAKLSAVFYRASEVFDRLGDRGPMGTDGQRFAAAQSFLYLEYGLAERLTLVGQTGAGQLTARNRLVKKQTRGVGGVDLALRYRLLDQPVALAPQVAIKVPTGYHAEYDPALGTGEADVEFRLLAGRSLYPWPGYLGAETGYRIRSGVFSDQVGYLLEAGATPHEGLFAKGYVEGVRTLSGEGGNSGVVGLAQVSEGDYVKAGLSAAFRARGSWWVDLLWERAVAGENIGAGGSWGVGMAYIDRNR